ncbi:MAG: protein-methionine-sulfoxide reductase catalytic subunit MsrP [Alphaproteobacteria bacterium]|nr:protein-methionine-sulfoxide reductase catalytic subunit MsrP [Alphaproteobacteria bacterium]
MLTRMRRGWELPEAAATPESVFRDRRRLLKAAAAGPVLLAAPAALLGCDSEEEIAIANAPDPTAHLYPVPRNERYAIDRAITAEEEATTYNNYYEFGSAKNIHKRARKLPIRPWTVTIGGMVEKEIQIGIDELIAKMPLEERLYRLRCVEAWAMAVPWSGFPMRALVDMARPLSGAKYVVMASFQNMKVAIGQREAWYPWPYIEGLTMAEATNELAFLATGIYGKPLPKQNGAPLRLAAPWKYGFKSAKGIVAFEFTDMRPITFWQRLQAQEYGFWANVNPAVPHPRWSQATERVLGTGERVPTQIFNGYGAFVAELYRGLESERLFV